MVTPLKRGEALRDRLTLTDLVCYVSQGRLTSSTSGARKDHGHPEGLATATEGHRFSPLENTGGAAKSGRGTERNTPPVSCRVRLPGGTRETSRGMRRHVDRRKGEPPDAMPRSRGGGGWGGGVGGRASRPHGEEEPWRRPLALGGLAQEGVSRACGS